MPPATTKHRRSLPAQATTAGRAANACGVRSTPRAWTNSSRFALADRHAVLQLVIADRDDRPLGIDAADDLGILIGFDPGLDGAPLRLAVSHLEDVVALAVVQHGVARHYPAGMLLEHDFDGHGRARDQLLLGCNELDPDVDPLRCRVDRTRCSPYDAAQPVIRGKD